MELGQLCDSKYLDEVTSSPTLRMITGSMDFMKKESRKTSTGPLNSKDEMLN